MEIIVKKDISHFNRELGMPINTRAQYNDELKRRGLVPKEQGDDIAKNARARQHKDYTPSTETVKFLQGVNDRKKKDGSVKLSGREITYMEKLGVHFKRVDKGIKGGIE